jgi:hypothetical protein
MLKHCRLFDLVQSWAGSARAASASRMGRRGLALTSRLLFVACGTTLLIPCLPDTHHRSPSPLRLSQARSCDALAASPTGLTRLRQIERHLERIGATSMGGGDSGGEEEISPLVDGGVGVTRQPVHALRLRGGHTIKKMPKGYVGGKNLRPDRQKRSHRQIPPHLRPRLR